MIVVDSNILAYLYLPGDRTEAAEALLEQDPDWAAPVLWRSEFRNILAGYLRRKTITFDQACSAQKIAENLLAGSEYAVDSVAIMALVVDGLHGRVLLGAFLAFVIATFVSFIGNALRSFGARPTLSSAVRFFAVNTVGLVLNMAIAWAMERAGAHYLLVSLVVLIVVPLFNFLGHRMVTFARSD